MEKAIHKKIIYTSLIVALLGIVLIFIRLLKVPDNTLLTYGSLLIVASIVSLITSFIVVNKYDKKLKKVAKYLLVSYPIVIVIVYLYIVLSSNGQINEPGPVQIVLIALFFVVTTFLSLIYIFVFADTTRKSWTIIILIFILLHILSRRIYIEYRLVTFAMSLVWIILGSIMFSIRCLYLSGGNNYFKYLSFSGNLLIALSFSGTFFKVMGLDGSNYLVNFADFSIVIATIIILVTIPSSGYLDWLSEQKQILKRLMIPWIFILFFFIMRYLLPEVWTAIYSSGQFINRSGFEMVDYKLK